MPKKAWEVGCGLAAAVLAGYGFTLTAPVFVIDDLGFVRDNPVFQLPFPRFAGALLCADYFQLTGERTYQPLVTFLHYFIHASPLWCRVSSLVIHAVNSLLVFLLCRRLRADERTSILAAVLFAFFPLSTEAVDISAFKGHLLALTFSAAALLLWESPWSCAAYALALFSKETALIVPVFAGIFVAVNAGERRRRLFRPFAYLCAISAVYAWIRFFVLRPISVSTVRFNPVSCAAWYLKSMVVPYPSCLAHGPTLVPHGLLALPALFLSCFWFARRNPFVLLCLSWILVSLLPFLQLIPFNDFNPVCERYLYMASAGSSALAAAALRGRPRLLAAALIAAWASLTIRRNACYREPRTLYEQTAACAPDVTQAHALLGDYRLSVRDYAGALQSYEKALSLDPKPADALENIGIAQYMLGDRKAARASLERALALEPGSERARGNLKKLDKLEGRRLRTGPP